MMKGFKAAGCDYAARAACVYSSLFISPSRNFLSPSHTHTHFWHWADMSSQSKAASSGNLLWFFYLVTEEVSEGHGREKQRYDVCFLLCFICIGFCCWNETYYLWTLSSLWLFVDLDLSFNSLHASVWHCRPTSFAIVQSIQYCRFYSRCIKSE